MGTIIFDALIKLPQFKVSILSRSSSNATVPEGFTVYKSDYSEADLVTVFKDQDVIISVVGIGGFSEQKKFIDAAVSAGVKRFIPSEFSGNTLSPTVLQLLPVFAPKKEVLDYLKEKEASGLTWTAIWPALLLDWVSDIYYIYNMRKKLTRRNRAWQVASPDMISPREQRLFGTMVILYSL